MGARFAELGGTVLPGSPAASGKLIAADTEEGEGSQVLRCQAGLIPEPLTLGPLHESRTANPPRHVKTRPQRAASLVYLSNASIGGLESEQRFIRYRCEPKTYFAEAGH